MKRLTLLRSGNWVTAQPCPPRVKDVLVPNLTFVEKRWKRGREKAIAAKAGRPPVEESEVECFTTDHKGRVTFPFGFVEPMTALLRGAGYEAVVENLTPPRDPSVFEPVWEEVFDHYDLKHRQGEFLAKIVAHENGLFGCPTGYGKSFLAGLTARLLPRARIAIVSRSVTVVRDRIFPELAQMVPNVGIVGGGKKKRGRRVMCYTSDSLRWLIRDAEEYGLFDILIFDECHLAAADNCSAMLALVPGQPRMFGLSATQDMRVDGKDYRVRALFGPLRMNIGYEEARGKGMVLPMEVVVRKVVMDVNPCSGMDGDDKLRYGVWRNSYRNDLILRDALPYAAAGMQTMISCQVLEHVLRLKQRFNRMKGRGEVPEGVELVCLYRQHDNRGDWRGVLRDMERKGLGEVFKKLPYMSNARRERLTKRIERGKILLFAGTTILNVGFDPKDLRVVSRADCTSNQIADTQVPGRNARHGRSLDGLGRKLKRKAIVRDYWDRFDEGLSRRFLNRRTSYERHGWKIKILTHKKTSLQERMNWE